MSIESLRALPVFNFVRMTYAAVILIKLYISVRNPTSQIGKVIDRESLRIGIYMPAMIDRLSEAVGPMQCRSPATFLGLLVRLHAWYENQELHEDFTGPVQLFSPDQFTPQTVDGRHNSKPDFVDSRASVSDLTQIRGGHEPIASIQARFGEIVPPMSFFSPDHDSVPTTSAGTFTEKMGDSFLLDSAQFDFDYDSHLDPYLFPEEINFRDARAHE